MSCFCLALATGEGVAGARPGLYAKVVANGSRFDFEFYSQPRMVALDLVAKAESIAPMWHAIAIQGFSDVRVAFTAGSAPRDGDTFTILTP